ncbi:MAG TPA: right-handed parallel beta-helix repeat-containing protein, partial [Prolixibacteraceae bacterium]|nr:right-handed parallel beta-helix repeat-containing protein [Prolixibacteraceae bacterium]
EFKTARNLYQQYKYARAQASDIFDIEAVAKYYAITDATNAYHTLHFFNQRFYYNPVIGKLEPVFFDSFADVGIFDYYGYNLIVENAPNAEVSVHLKLFADPKFRELYFQYLDKYTSAGFWKNLYHENKAAADSINDLLKTEYPDYQFKIESFYEVAEKARQSLVAVKAQIEKEDWFSKFKEKNLAVNTLYKGKADFELLPHLISVYTQKPNTFRIENYTTDTIKITGFSDIPQLQMEKLETPVTLPPANSGASYVTTLTSQTEGNKFVFAQARNKELVLPVIPWGAPQEPKFLEVRHSFDSLEVAQNYKAEFINDSIIFSGNIRVDNNLVIPENKSVVFKKGTKLDLVNNATFISYSPVYVRGTQNKPVVFSSSDNTGQGINIFQAKKRSVVKNATFTGLTNLDFGGWVTTTGVCFYESDVNFYATRFEKNVGCDDALNVIRSEFYLEGCTFENTFADAFDSDFCTGEIVSTQFIRPGNDGLDCSGSFVKVKNCTFAEVADKGVSGGENSTIIISGITINGANIGVASKDLSTVNIEDSEFRNVTYGLVAFQKKPEYGPAEIISQNVNIKKNLFIHIIEEESTLTFNNRKIFGQERNLANRFY